MQAFIERTAEITDRIPGVGLLVAGLFLFFSLVWWLGSQVLLGVVAVGIFIARGQDVTALGAVDPMDLMPTWLMAAGYWLTVGGMVLVGVVLAPLTGRTQRQAFALGGTRWWALGLAMVAGLSVGVFPGWVAENLRLYLPEIELGALDMITDMLTVGPLWERGLMILAVCIGAPLLEEMVFRGFLWDALERTLPVWFVWLLTSVVFAAYHVDPVQGSAVLFTGLALGWMRWSTGSLWPAVLMHMVNNTLATVAAMLWTAEDLPPTPWWVGLLAAAITLALVAPAWWARRPRTEPL